MYISIWVLLALVLLVYLLSVERTVTIIMDITDRTVITMDKIILTVMLVVKFLIAIGTVTTLSLIKLGSLTDGVRILRVRE